MESQRTQKDSESSLMMKKQRNESGQQKEIDFMTRDPHTQEERLASHQATTSYVQ